ncbi:hypothetical protein LIER_15672 [Lithospermum erythrorhizon]|uniref:Retroviral polymerase SH3-like domain-containing protein n=1 Tax=Lithospermum erythrorhizon TaxID=34254 RepID=A0AAV3Q5A3_LITER
MERNFSVCMIISRRMGWKLFDFETREYFVSRDVVFYEQEFPFASKLPCFDVPVLLSDLPCSSEDEEEEEPSGVPGLGGAIQPCEGAAQPEPPSPGVQAAPQPLDEVDLLPCEESSTLVGSDRSAAPPPGTRVDGDGGSM